MSFDREDPSDAEFERSLLESARKDAPPHSAQDAWARFAGALSLVAPSPAPGSDLCGPGTSAGATGAGTVTKAAGARAVRMAALKWLLLGAIGGSAATAVIERREWKPNSLAPAVERMPAAPVKVAEAVRTPLLAALEPRTTSPGTPARRPGQARTRPIQHKPGVGHVTETLSTADDQAKTVRHLAAASSTLAAEVSWIDAARTASLDGNHDEAIRLIERYHRDFPKGALGPDADVVALEAVAAKRDRAEVARRSALFLSQYPSDPHAARVRGLADR